MSERIDLRGKSRDEIEALTKGWRRQRWIEAIVELVTLECFFSPTEVAKARRLPKRTIVSFCKDGTIPAHKPLENKYRISQSGLATWDRATAVTLPGQNGNGQN